MGEDNEYFKSNIVWDNLKSLFFNSVFTKPYLLIMDKVKNEQKINSQFANREQRTINKG